MDREGEVELTTEVSEGQEVIVKIDIPKPFDGWQDEFVRSTAERIVTMAGRQSAKTFGFAIKAGMTFLGRCLKCLGSGCASCEFTGEAEAVPVLYAAPTTQQLDRFWFEIVDMLSPGIDAGVFKKDETTHGIEIPGTEIKIKAMTAWNAGTLRGGNWGLIGLDEFQLMNEDIWAVVMPMLMRWNGKLVLMFTPPSLASEGITHAKDMMHAPKLYKQVLEDSDNGRWKLFHATSYENPYLSKKALANISSDMKSVESYRREILAEIDEIEQIWLVYGKFDDNLCKIKRFPIPDNWPVFTGHDFGCVDDETEILTKRGWKRQGEVGVGDITLTFNLNTGKSEWQPILAMNRYQGKHDMRLMTQRGHNSFTTLNHRWAVDKRSGKRLFSTTEDLKARDAIQVVAECANLPTEPSYSDSFVELMGWFWTEGQIDAGGVSIWQNEGDKAEQIRRCLTAEFGESLKETRNGRERAVAGWVERPKRKSRTPRGDRHFTGKIACHFAINLNGAERIIEVAPDKIVKPEFIASLTLSQLKLFVETSIKGDGWQRRGSNGNQAGQSINQSHAHTALLEAFQIACSLLGLRTTIAKSSNKRTLLSVQLRKRLAMTRMRKEDVVYDGLVWCPTTANGTWFARRKGTVYFTGNSANHAALFVAQVRLPLPPQAPNYLRIGDYVAFAEYAPAAGSSAERHIESYKDIMGRQDDGTLRLKLERAVGGNVTTEEETRQLYRRLGWNIRPPEITRVKLQIDRAMAIVEQNQFYVFEDLHQLLGQMHDCKWEIDPQTKKPLDRVKDEPKYHLLSAWRYLATVLTPKVPLRGRTPQVWNL